MRKSPFYRDDFVGATQKIVDTRTAQKSQADGVVAIVDTIGVVQIQLRGASNFTPVDVSEGIKVSVGDHVLLRRSTDTSRWIIYQNFGSGGRTTGSGNSSSSSGSAVAAPTNFLVRGALDGLLFTWTPLAPDGGFIYEIDIADDTGDTHSVIYQVAGAAWYSHATGTHSCRIRSVGSDWTRSGWTDWVTASSSISGKDIQVNGADQPSEPKLNLVSGSGISLVGTDDSGLIRSTVVVSANFDVILTDDDGNVLSDDNGNVLTDEG